MNLPTSQQNLQEQPASRGLLLPCLVVLLFVAVTHVPGWAERLYLLPLDGLTASWQTARSVFGVALGFGLVLSLGAASLHPERRWLRWLLPLVAFPVFLGFASNTHRGDAVYFITIPPHGQMTVREIVPLMNYHFAWQISKWWSPVGGLFGSWEESIRAVRLVNVLSGCLVYLLLPFLAEHLSRLHRREDQGEGQGEGQAPESGPSHHYAQALFLLFAGAFGTAQMAFGHIEAYPQCLAFQVLVLTYLLWTWSSGARAFVVLPSAFGVMGHLALVFMVPSSLLAYLAPIFRDAAPGRRWQRLRGQVWGELAALVIIATVVLLSPTLRGDVWNLVRVATTETRNAPSGFLTLAELLTVQVFSERLRDLFLLAWAVPGLMLLLLASGRWRCVVRRGSFWYAVVLAGPFLVWTFTWRPILGAVMDWDLYLLAMMPLLVLGAALLREVWLSPGLRGWLVALLLGQVAHSVCYLASHHLHHEGLELLWLREVNFSEAGCSGGPGGLSVRILPPEHEFAHARSFGLRAEISAEQDLDDAESWVFLIREDGPVLFNHDIWIPNPGARDEHVRLPAGTRAEVPLLLHDPRATPREYDHLPEFLQPGSYTLGGLLVRRGSREVLLCVLHEFTVTP